MRRPSRRRRRDDAGVSSVELVLYMPLLMFVIFIAVQFSLVWFGNQAASAVARETARTARVYDDDGRAGEAGHRYAATDRRRRPRGRRASHVTRVGDDRVRVTVTGRAQEISPIGVPTVSQTVEGPIEEFQDERAMTRGCRRDERGSMAVEVVILAPVLLMFVMLVVAGGRYVGVQGDIEAAARDAARAAVAGGHPRRGRAGRPRDDRGSLDGSDCAGRLQRATGGPTAP